MTKVKVKGSAASTRSTQTKHLEEKHYLLLLLQQLRSNAERNSTVASSISMHIMLPGLFLASLPEKHTPEEDGERQRQGTE